MSQELVRANVYQPIISLVLDGLTSARSRVAYGHALSRFMEWYASQGQSNLNKALVQRYRIVLEQSGFSPSTINLHMSAIRKLALEAYDNGLLDNAIANGISRVKGVKRQGVRTGNWLSAEQAFSLISAPDVATLKGRRDRAILSIMIGAGLRRSEVSGLEFRHLSNLEGRWVIVDLVGKGNRSRSIPIANWIKASLDAWSQSVSFCSGRVFRAMNKADRVTDQQLSSQTIHDLVKYYGSMVGLEIAPHDLRRTYAKLARAGNSPLEQIQLSLGHASIQTTERYLGTLQNLTDSPSDRIKLGAE